MLSLMMALVMCLSLPLSVLAEEGVVEVETTAGNPEPVNVTITIEETSRNDGSVQTGTTTVAENHTTDSGMTVDFQGQSDMTATPDGTTTGSASTAYTVTGEDGTYHAEGGSETTISGQAPTGTVEVPLTTEEGENQNTITGDPSGTTETTGDVPTGENDGIYDYTTETVTREGSITVTTNDITLEENIGAPGTDLDHVHTETGVTSDNDLFTSGLYQGNPTCVDPTNVTEDQIPEAVEGYDYNLISTGNSSQFYAGFLYKTPGYEGEQPAYVAQDGTPYYARRTDLGNNHKLEGAFLNGQQDAGYDTVYKAVWANVAQYVLVDAETGELITTYCADLTTQTQDGYGYNIQNVEDASYYSEEQAAMIRTIAKNGYWGVEDDGTGKTGSLAAMQKMMEEAVDADGNRVFTDEEVASLTDGIAMSATQYAIWTFSNEMDDIQILNSQYIPKDENNMGNGWSYSHLKNIPETEKDSVALIFKLYNHLINLEPTQTTGTTKDTIINADNFLKNMDITVVDKAEDHVNNADTNSDNDAYVADLSFALVVTPSTENGDDLTVQVLDSNGNIVASGRIAGQAQEGETVLTPDEQGNYTFSGITLVEGNQNFNITLEGVQNLEEGVYLYTSEIREEVSSQTMVGLAGGDRAVSVSMNIEFNLDVQDEVVVRERVWRTEWTTDPPAPEENDPEADPQDLTVPEEEEPVTTFMIREEPAAAAAEAAEDGEAVDGLLEIPDEEVPLADAPKTGDGSLILAAISALSGIGYAGITFTTRRKEQ